MGDEPNTLQFILPGRPVPWARARQDKGQFFTPTKQAGHRKLLADVIAIEMRKKKIKPFDGRVELTVDFDYGENETRIIFLDAQSPDYKLSRPDLDNLIKQVADAAQDSGLVADDAQIVLIKAAKWQ